MAFRIDPSTLYTRTDLLGELGALGIDADNLIARIRPARRIRQAYWGRDLIEAMNTAPLITELPHAAESVKDNLDRPARGGGRRKSATPALDAILAESTGR